MAKIKTRHIFYIEQHEKSYVTTRDILKLSLDVSKGCQYLEQNKFIHR